MSFMGSACAFGLTDGRHFGYFWHILLENHELSYGPDIVERPSGAAYNCYNSPTLARLHVALSRCRLKFLGITSFPQAH